ncbi:MAG: bifunctional UDP-N-acetylglucosamine diphosphorylase/glucosamine-1-phosphate N-acetyltransferase GlmU [Gammaproteobacteria bacterium]|nr:bifunctional UDP-N-acetylglucosamine diphosphorylase/glucosamine-1-phosphate N-acetyltransferase GlmU [Gammaproteobacteria bacterium]
MSVSVVILAAGQGKRMHSDLPKILHRLADKPLLEHVVNTASSLQTADAPIVIFGHEGGQVQHALAHLNVHWVPQTELLGTGHAVLQALPLIDKNSRVLILYGDVPLISTATLKNLMDTTPKDAIGILTAEVPNPHGFGRIIRDNQNTISSIIEEKDASAEQRLLKEINSGIYLIPAQLLKKWLPLLQNNNAQKEYYLTDIIANAAKENISIHSLQPLMHEEILGVNDRVQLATLERIYQKQQAEKLMRNGVTLYDPSRIDVRGELMIEQDTTVDINVIFSGHCKIGHHCTIGPNVTLHNVIIGNYVEIKANSVLDGAEISDHCVIGPFARIRPGTELATNTHVGNFVEIKNSIIGQGSKINHLSYIGDSDIGKHVNIGAGTITCNYDGVNKHRTVIGDYAFIGSDTQLVAPVSIGTGATIGAGSTITRNAPADQLTICRSQQRSIENWQRPKKKEI